MKWFIPLLVLCGGSYAVAGPPKYNVRIGNPPARSHYGYRHPVIVIPSTPPVTSSGVSGVNKPPYNPVFDGPTKWCSPAQRTTPSSAGVRCTTGGGYGRSSYTLRTGSGTLPTFIVNPFVDESKYDSKFWRLLDASQRARGEQ